VAIPAAVLVETTTERPDHALIDRVIRSVDLEIPLTPARARAAGILCARAIAARTRTPASRVRPPSPVDATVMAEAASLGAAVVLTSDPDELVLLREVAGLSAREVEIVAV
jgi:hypothetical protein